MPARLKVDALVFSRRNSGEADRIVTLFTKEQGLIQAVAKGVRRIPSHRGGHLEPLTKVHVLLQESRAGAYITTVETVDYHSPLRESPDLNRHASNIALVVNRLFERNDPQPALYSMVEQAWEKLPLLAEKQRFLLESATIVTALRLAGMMPDLMYCAACRTRQPSEAVILKAHEAGWHCLSCHGSLYHTEHSLSPRLLKVLRFVVQSPLKSVRLSVSEDESRQLINAVYRYVADIVEQPAMSMS